MPNDVFLDTSALIDLCFRSPALRDHVLESLGREARLHSSRYVIFELARGYLKHLLVLHNKASDLDAFSNLVQYMKNRGIGGQYAGPTMLGAYQDFVEQLEAAGTSLTEYQRLSHFRAWLALLIRKNWRAITGGLVQITNPIGCRDDIPAPVANALPNEGRPREHFSQELPTPKCGHVGNCTLIAALQQDQGVFVGVLAALQAIEKPDAETTRRVSALGRLLEHPPERPFPGKDCHSVGDAIIAHEAAPGQTVVSKNEKHFNPLCQEMGKTLHCYKEPAVPSIT